MENQLPPRVDGFGTRGQDVANYLFASIQDYNSDTGCNVGLCWDPERALFTLRRSSNLSEDGFLEMLMSWPGSGWYPHGIRNRTTDGDYQVNLRQTPIPGRRPPIAHRPIVREYRSSSRRLQQSVTRPFGLGHAINITRDTNISGFVDRSISVIGPYIHNNDTGQLFDAMGNMVQATMGHFQLKHVFGLGTLCMGVEYNADNTLSWVIRRIGDWGGESRVSCQNAADMSCFPLGHGFQWVLCYHPQSGHSAIQIFRGRHIVKELLVVNHFASLLSDGRFATINKHIGEVLIWGPCDSSDSVVLERSIRFPDASRIEARYGFLHVKDKRGMTRGWVDRLGLEHRALSDDQNEHFVFHRGSQAFLTRNERGWCLSFRLSNNVRIRQHVINAQRKPNVYLFLGAFLCMFHTNQITIWSDSGCCLQRVHLSAGADSCEFTDNGRDTLAVLCYRGNRLFGAEAWRFSELPLRDLEQPNTPEILDDFRSASFSGARSIPPKDDTILTIRSILEGIAKQPGTSLQLYEVDAVLTTIQILPPSDWDSAFQMCHKISPQVPGLPLLLIHLIQHEKVWSAIEPYYQRLTAIVDNPQDLARFLRQIISSFPSEYESVISEAKEEQTRAICPQLSRADQSWLNHAVIHHPEHLRVRLLGDCASLLEAIPATYIQNVSQRQHLRVVVNSQMDDTARRNLVLYAETWASFYSRVSLTRLPEHDYEPFISKIMHLPDNERELTLEISRPIMEAFSGEQLWSHLSSILDLPMEQRRDMRNAILAGPVDTENVMDSRFHSRVQHARQEMFRLLGSPQLIPELRSKTLENIKSHLLSYLSSLTPAEAEELLQQCLLIQRPPRGAWLFSWRRRSDIEVRQSWNELEAKLDTRLQPGQRRVLSRIRANAPELANALCTLDGPTFSQDYSVSMTRSRDSETVEIALMTWMLIETLPALAANRLSSADIAREVRNMEHEYVMALAQCIDEEHNHRVCGPGHCVRFCSILAGDDRYPTIRMNFETVEQSFTMRLMAFHTTLNDNAPTKVQLEEFLNSFLLDGFSHDEIEWVVKELEEFCNITDWDFSAAMVSFQTLGRITLI